MLGHSGKILQKGLAIKEINLGRPNNPETLCLLREDAPFSCLDSVSYLGWWLGERLLLEGDPVRAAGLHIILRGFSTVSL